MSGPEKGYEGAPCPACGSFTLVRNGHLYEIQYLWGDYRLRLNQRTGVAQRL